MPRLMGKAHWLAAAAVYAAAALFAFRVVLPNPSALVPYSAHLKAANLAIDQSDQQFVVASIARAARAMGRAPTTLWDNLQCHPMFRPVTLGEHMFGEGLLGAVPALATDDPVFTYDAVLILGVWVAGLTMYALVRYWTGSTGAALVAGLLFAVQPGRIGDPTHPFVHGDLWSPLVLLAIHTLFVRRSWTAAAAFTLAVGLVLLESLYAVVALVLIALVYVPYLLVRFRAELWGLLPKLAAVAVASAGIAAAIFGPYLHTRAVWGVLEGRGGLLLPIEQFLPGAFYYPGTVLLVLAAIAVIDRFRGARAETHGYDPRLVFLAAALLVFWTVVWGIPVPGTDVVIHSPYAWVQSRIPGLGAIRAVPAARTGTYLCLTFLAGYGVWLVGRRLGGWGGALATTVLVAAVAVETFHPVVGEMSLGVSPVAMKTRRLAPLPPLRALVRQLPDGAVLDVPLRLDALNRFAPMAHDILLGAYHQRPVAACYNSFTVPILDQMAALAARLPDPAALAALYALGYRSLLVHDEFLDPPTREAFRTALATPAAGPVRLVEAGSFGFHRVLKFEGTERVTTDPVVLAAVEPWEDPDRVPAGTRVPVRFRLRNHSGAAFRLADPIEPSELLVTWRPLPSGRATTERVRTLLPLALAGGEEQFRALELRTPDVAGRYEASLAPTGAPDVEVARTVVEVGA
jgi:hypothetical protein